MKMNHRLLTTPATLATTRRIKVPINQLRLPPRACAAHLPSRRHHAHAGYARPAEQLRRPTPGYPPNADPPHDRAPCQSCFCEKPPPTGASASHATPAYGETMTDYATA